MPNSTKNPAHSLINWHAYISQRIPCAGKDSRCRQTTRPWSPRTTLSICHATWILSEISGTGCAMKYVGKVLKVTNKNRKSDTVKKRISDTTYPDFYKRKTTCWNHLQHMKVIKLLRRIWESKTWKKKI